MNGYSEDLRRRIVSAVEGGVSKSQAARTFSVSLSFGQTIRQQGRAGRILGLEEETRIRSEAGREGEEAQFSGP
jgi:transposase